MRSDRPNWRRRGARGSSWSCSLAVRRLDFERAGSPTGPAGARALQVLNDLEKRTLEVQQQEVEKSKNVADRRKEIIKRRLEILEAQRRIVSGG